MSAEVFSGTRTLLGFDQADPSNPFAALWSPLGQAGHVPNIVRHEAFTRIEMVAASAGKVAVGPTPRQPAALATEVGNAFDIVIAAFTEVNSYATAVGVAIPAAAPAATALNTTLMTPVTGLLALLAAQEALYTSLKLEAQ